jgi:hypothetical protein
MPRQPFRTTKRPSSNVHHQRDPKWSRPGKSQATRAEAPPPSQRQSSRRQAQPPPSQQQAVMGAIVCSRVTYSNSRYDGIIRVEESSLRDNRENICDFKRNNILDRCYRDEEGNTRGPYAPYIHRLSAFPSSPLATALSFPFLNVILFIPAFQCKILPLACAASFHRMIATRLRFLALSSSSIYLRRR